MKTNLSVRNTDIPESGRTERLVLLPLHERFLIHLRATLQTPRWHFQNVIRDARVARRHTIEDVFEWKFDVFTTSLAAGDRKMRVGIAGQFSRRTAQAKYWSKIQREVEKALLELTEHIDSNG